MQALKFLLSITIAWVSYISMIADDANFNNKTTSKTTLSSYQPKNNTALQSITVELTIVQHKVNNGNEFYKFFYDWKGVGCFKKEHLQNLYPAIGYYSPSKQFQRLLIYPFHFFT